MHRKGESEYSYHITRYFNVAWNLTMPQVLVLSSQYMKYKLIVDVLMSRVYVKSVDDLLWVFMIHEFFFWNDLAYWVLLFWMISMFLYCRLKTAFQAAE